MATEDLIPLMFAPGNTITVTNVPPPAAIKCPGCGELVARSDAYAEGPPPFHVNASGGGHTMERACYGPHTITHEPTGKEAYCGGPGFCQMCDETWQVWNGAWVGFDDGMGTIDMVHIDQSIPYTLVDTTPTKET